MFRSIPSSLFALSLCLSALPAQDPAPVKQPDKEVATKLEELKDCINDRKMERDAEAVQIIDFLWKKLDEGLCDKDQQAITKSLDAALSQGKVRQPEDARLYTAAVAALAYCGADGAKALKKAYENKRFGNTNEKPWLNLRDQMLRSIGKTKDESMVKFLVDEARRNPEDILMAAAGEALGNYEAAKEPVRKEIVSDLIKRWGELDELATQMGSGNIQAANARNTLAALTGKWNETLAKLTRQNFTKFTDWQSWYNKNKTQPWK
ncbi:MAG: hypothetical protein U1E73_13600 [Planctomycetota bacterium]